MKHKTQQTSKEALEEFKPKRANYYLKITALLSNFGSLDNTQISKFLEIPINVITPRVNELRKMGFVTYSHKAICPITKKNVMFWTLNRNRNYKEVQKQ